MRKTGLFQRILALVLCAVMLVGYLPSTAFTALADELSFGEATDEGTGDAVVEVPEEEVPEEETTEGPDEPVSELVPLGLHYVIEDETVVIIGYEGTASTLVIPAEIEGLPVTRIEEGALADNQTLTSVVLPDSITEIGSWAFNSCMNLTSVIMPDGACVTGNYPFGGSENMTFTEYEGGMYLRSRTNPYAYLVDTSDKSVTTLTIHPDTQNIAGNAIWGFGEITELTIPDSVLTIAQNSIYGCVKVATVHIGSGLEYLGTNNFFGFDSLTAFTVSEDNANFSTDESGVLFNENKTVLIKAPAALADGYQIPDTVKEIGSRAFSGCSNLTAIVIPEGVETIGNSAFDSCSSLKTVTVPNSVVSLGGYAFSGCEALEYTVYENAQYLGNAENPHLILTGVADRTAASVTIHENARMISQEAFVSSAITEIAIPDGVVSVGTYAFANCQSLSSVTIGSGLEDMGEGVFVSCPKLMTISVSSENTHFCTDDAGILFDYDKTVLFRAPQLCGSYEVPQSVKVITYAAFFGCTELSSVTLPDSVEVIEDAAFEGCDSLMLYFSMQNEFFAEYAQNWSLSYAYNDTLAELSVQTLPNKLTYALNSKIRTAGLVLLAVLEDGTEVQLTDGFTVDPCDTSTEGVKTVTVHCGNLSASFEITVDASIIELPESDHPYANNMDETWTYTHPTEVLGLWITFSAETKTEGGCDTITILDASGAQVGVYSGEELSGATIGVTGSSFTIHMTTDVSVTYYGFTVASIAEITSEEDLPEVVPAGLEYGFMEDGSAVIHGYSGSETTLKIPSKINGHPVTRIGNDAFNGNSNLTEVILPDSITQIGDYAFVGCQNLSSVTLGNGLTYIGYYAFAQCPNLTELILPESVEEIGEDVGYGCGEGLWKTYGNAYYLGTAENPYKFLLKAIDWQITEVQIHPDTKVICQHAFADRSGLTNVTIPEGVEKIEYYAFAWCYNLESVQIPDSVTTLGDSAFYCCESMSSVSIGSGLTQMGQEVFTACRNLQSVQLSEENTAFCIDEYGVLLNKEKTELISALLKDVKSYEVPATVLTIRSFAFENCDNLSSITIGNAVQNIEAWAFSSCDSLYEVTIPASVTNLAPTAFVYCANLTAIRVDGENTTYCSDENGAVYSADGTTLVCVPAGIDSLTVPNGVTAIGDSAFQGTGLQEVILPEGLTTIGSQSFYYCYNLESVVIPEGVTTIGDSAFWDNQKLTQVVIPASVTSIGGGAFAGCNSLVVYAPLNSYAQTYASENDLTFVCTDVATELTVTSLPTKLIYPLGGKLKLDGLTLSAVFENGETATITAGYTVDECDTTTAGTKTVTVHCCGQSATFEITVDATLVEYPESDHPYGSNMNETWSYMHPTEALGLKITFSEETFFQEYCDFLTVYDATGSQVGYYTADQLAGKTISLVGRSFTLNLQTDGGVEYYGFAITSIEPITDEAELPEVIPEGLQYGILDDHVVINGYEGSASELKIPSKINDKPVRVINPWAFSGNANLTSVIIPDTVETIYYGAFYNCSNLQSVTLGSGVTQILGEAFAYCSALTSLTIPDSVTVIEYDAFAWCTALTELNIGGNIETMGGGIFRGCSALTSVTLPDTLEAVGPEMFAHCSGLTEVIFGSDLKSIGENAFYGCDQLQYNTYGNAYYLGSGENPYFALMKVQDQSVQEIEIHPDTVIIGGNAFSNCYNLTAVTIPDSVKSIGGSAFARCERLQSVTLGAGLTTIGSDAFASCQNLTQIHIPASVTEIGNSAFYNCQNLTGVWVAEENPAYSSDENGVLYNKEKTELIKAPGGLSGSFTIPETVQSIGNRAFEYCRKITEVIIPNSVTIIGYNAFYDCDLLTSVTVPASVTEIGSGAFEVCGSLTGIWVAEENTAYSSDASGVLFNKDKTTLIQAPGAIAGSYEIPGTVTQIGQNAFAYCRSLTQIVIPESVTQLNNYAFYCCSGLTSVTLPGSIERIPWNAFGHCSNLTEVTIGSGTVSIEGYAFYQCPMLEKVMVPDTVTQLYRSSFEGSSSVKLYCSIDSYAASAAAENNIPVVYTDAATELSVATQPDKLTYGLYGKLKLNGLSLNVTLADGTVKTVSTGYTVDACDTSEVGTKTVTVHCCGLSTTFEITVDASVVELPESDHPYAQNMDETWKYVHPTEALGLKITFSTDTYVQDYNDYILVYDANGILMGEYTGSSLAGQTVAVNGSSFTVRLMSSQYGSDYYGFAVTAVEEITSEEELPEAIPYGLNYSIENETVIIVGYSSREEILKIPATIEGYPVTKIRSWALTNTYLKEVYVPESVTELYADSLGSSGKLTAIWVDENNPSYSSDENGILFNKEKTALITLPSGYSGDYTVPETVESIGSGAFSYTPNLTSVTIHAGVTHIGGSAFYACNGLTGIWVDEENAAYCSDENGVLYDKAMTRVMKAPTTLSGSYVIPDGVTTVDYCAFQNCSALTAVTVPDSVTYINGDAFLNCNSLTLYIPVGGYAESFAVEYSIPYEYTVDVAAISIATLPNKLAYPVGGNVKLDGLTLNVELADGTTTVASTGYTMDACDTSEAGVKTVTVRYAGLTVTFEITVDPELVLYPESDHPYGDNMDQSWTYTHKTDVEALAITFSSDTETESNYDYIYIYDADGNEVGVYDGTSLAGQTVTVSGSSFTIRMTSDGGSNYYGFEITSVVDADEIPTASDAVDALYALYPNGMAEGSELVYTITVDGVEFTTQWYIEYGSEAVGFENDCVVFYPQSYDVEYKIVASIVDSSVSAVWTGTVAAEEPETEPPTTQPDLSVYPESDHPYATYTEKTWQYVHPEEALALKVTFSEATQTETRYDFIYIYDAVGNQIGQYDGTELAGQTVMIGGSSFSVRLTSDGSNEYYGFAVTDVQAVTDETELWQYTIDTDHAVITGYNSVASELIIPDELGGYPVTVLGSDCFSGKSSLVSVVIPEGVTTIGDNAFLNCYNLESVTIPSSVATIGAWSFYGCSGLTGVQLPSSLTQIGQYAFCGCTGMTTLSLNSGLTTIGESAFSSCSSLEAVSIPDSVTSMGANAFMACGNLKELTLGSGLTAISSYAFSNCSSLTTVTIPNNVTLIGSQAFSHCSGLTELTMGTQVSVIENGAFQNCSSLTAVSLPETLTQIGYSAFEDCSGLTEVVIPDSVTVLGDNVFSECSGLTEITLGSGLQSIGSQAFYNCSSLSSVSIPASVTSIGSTAFIYCTSLTAVTVHEDNANYSSDDSGVLFSKDQTRLIQAPGKLTGAYVIPETVTYMDEWAFGSCTALTEITIPNSLSSVCYSAFNHCSSLTTVNIAEGIESIESYAFADCGALTAVHIPDSVTSIASYAFVQSDNVKIYCSEGSYAEEYAIANSIPYVHTRSFVELSIATLPSKVIYPIDGTLKLNGLTLNAVYDDGQVKTITDGYEVESCDMSTAGVKTVTVTFAGLTATFEITVDPDLIEYPESDHDYTHNMDQTWVYTHRTPAASLKVTFAQETYTEYSYDFIYVLDAEGNELGKYDGTALAGQTLILPGNSFSIRMTTDGSVSGYGFKITGVQGLETEETPFMYLVQDDRVTITGYWGSAAELEIPAQMDGYPVTNIQYNVFMDHTELTSVTIPTSVTYIDSNAFSGCSAITDVYYGGSEEQWQAIAINSGNEALTGAAIHYGHTHTYGDWVIDWNATCTQEGQQSKTCSDCGQVESEAIPMTEHSYETQVVQPTYFEQGYTLHTCSVCGDSYTTDYVDPLTRTDISEATLTLEYTSAYYEGKALTPAVTLTYDGQTYDPETELYVTYTDNDKVGTATVTVEGINKFTGTVQLQFTISYEVIPEQIVNVIAIGEIGKVSLSWGRSSEVNTTTYRIYRKAADESEFVLVSTVYGRENLSWEDTQVEKEQTYSYYVTGVGMYGAESEASETVTAIVQVDMTAPTVLKLTPASGSIIHGKASLYAVVTDNVGVVRVAYFYSVDNEVTWNSIGEATYSGFGITFDTTELSGAVKIKAIAYDAEGNESEPLTAVYSLDNVGPDQVTGLTATTLSSKITLSWDDVQANDAASFTLQVLEGDAWKTVATGITTLGYTVTGLQADTEYTYRVACVDTHGNVGVYSEEFTAKTSSDTVAPVITDLSPGSGRYNDSIHFYATARDDCDVAKIEIQLSTDLSDWATISEQVFENRSGRQTYGYTVDLTDLADGSIFLRAIATDFSGNVSDSSAEAPYTEYIVDRTAPNAPQGVTANGADGYITVSWTIGSEPDLGRYYVYRSDALDGEYTLIASYLSTSNYHDRNVQDDAEYYYKVMVSDSCGNMSQFSDAVSATMSPDTQMPAITGVTTTYNQCISSISSTVQISASDNNKLSSLIVEYCTSLNSEYAQLAAAESLNSYYHTISVDLPIAELEDGTVIYLRAYAVDHAGLRSEYETVKYTVDNTAPAAENFGAQIEGNEVTLTWNDCGEEDLAGFRVYRSVDGVSFTMIGSRGVNTSGAYTFVDTIYAEESHTYTYKLEAVDGLGNSASWTNNVEYTYVYVNKAPTARITASDFMTVGVEELFDASGSSDDIHIDSYLWDFGDGTQSTDIQPAKSYESVGTYTVTLTVTDNEGVSASYTKKVEVKERDTLGTLNVKVTDDSNKALAHVPVYFDLGSESQKIVYTDSYGVATLKLPSGSHTIGMYAQGYLPVKKNVVVLANAIRTVSLTTVEQEIVTGNFEITRMTFDEIVAAGIDIYDPANQNVYSATVRVTYGASAPLNLSYIRNDSTILDYTITDSSGTPVKKYKDDNGEEREITGVTYIPIGGYGGGGGGGGEGSDIVAIIDIPASASYLKEFFDVRLHIINNASSDFVLENNEVVLNVPAGMTLMTSVTGGYYTSNTVSFDTLRGQENITLSWVLRGDEAGDYDLSADYTGILAEFNEIVSARFETDEPIKVYGLEGVKFRILACDEIHNETLYFNVEFENQRDIDIYMPAIGLTERVYNVTESVLNNNPDGDFTAECYILNAYIQSENGKKLYVPVTYDANGKTTTGITTLAPGQKIVYEYVAYNAIDYNGVAYFKDAAIQEFEGLIENIEVGSMTRKRYSFMDYSEKLDSILVSPDQDHADAFNHIMYNDYYYVDEAENSSAILESLYKLADLVLSADTSVLTQDEQRDVIRQFILYLLSESSMVEQADDMVTVRYYEIVKDIIGYVETGVLNDYVDEGLSAENVSSAFADIVKDSKELAVLYREKGSEAFYQELSSKIGQSALGLTIDASLYITLEAESKIVSDAWGVAQDVTKAILSAAQETEKEAYYYAMLKMRCNSEISRTLLNAIIEVTSAELDSDLRQSVLLGLISPAAMVAKLTEAGLGESTLVLQIAVEMREQLENNLDEFYESVNLAVNMVEEFGELAAQAAIKAAMKAALGSTPLALVTAAFSILDAIFGWDSYYKQIDTLQIYATLSDIFQTTFWDSAADRSEDNDMTTMVYLMAITELRLKGEAQFKSFMDDYLVGKYGKPVSEQKMLEKVGSSHDTLDAWYDDLLYDIVRSRDILFNVEGLSVIEIPRAPVVTLDYNTLQTVQTFTSEYEYCFADGVWHTCEDNAPISFTVGVVPSVMRVRKAAGVSSLAGQITTVRVYAQKELSKLITVKFDGVNYWIDNLSADRQYQIVFTDEEGTEVDWSYAKTIRGSADPVKVSGIAGHTYMVIRSCLNADLMETVSIPLQRTVSHKQLLNLQIEGSGTVYQTDSTGTYYIGDTVDLVATPLNGSEFVGWYIGDTCVSTDACYIVEMDADIVVRAVFTGSSIKGIAITRSARKKSYAIGENVDTNGMEVTVTYEDGTEMQTEQYTAQMTSNLAGDTDVMVCYGGMTTSYRINISECDHVFGIWHEETAPTCTTEGLQIRYCSVCDARETEILASLGHIEVILEGHEPTCTETGLTEGKYCERCGETLTEQEDIPALGHNEVTDAAVEPTCTETGLTEGKHCSRCGETLTEQEDIPALGHNEVTDAAVEPTCTETGLTEGKHCDRCGETLIAQEVVPALGHDEVTDAAVEPTCTETGLTEGKHCSRCGETLTEQEEVPALGHDEVTDAAVEPTCTETGLTEGKHCDRCGETLIAQEEIPALGHDEVTDAAVEPTCTETGLTEGKHCDRCGETLIAQEIVPALGHDEVTDAAVEPTCTETGLTEGKHCDRCGEILVAQTELPMIDHVYGEWVVVKTPTFTASGRREKTCTGCGKVISEVMLPATGKVEQWNVSLLDNLQVNFHLLISEGIENTATVKVMVGDRVQTYRVSDLELTEDGLYQVSVSIAAAQMNDDIVLVILNGHSMGDVVSYSVQQYAETVLADASLSQYHAMVKEMLNYGAAAQTHFDYNADNLVNEGITGVEAADVPTQADQEIRIDGELDGISYYANSLVYADRVAVRFYYKVTGDIADYSFTVGDAVYQPIQKGDYYYVEVPGITPENLDKQVEMTVTDAEGNTLTAAYSPMNYIVRMNAKGSDSLKALLRALYNYHLAAKALKAAN